MASGWKTTDGEPVVNLELIKLVHFMISKREGPVEVSCGVSACVGPCVLIFVHAAILGERAFERPRQ